MNSLVFLIAIFLIFTFSADDCHKCSKYLRNCQECQNVKFLSFCIDICPSGYEKLSSECLHTETILIESHFYDPKENEISSDWISSSSSQSQSFLKIKNRGLYQRSNSRLDSVSSYSFMGQFSLILWVNIFEDGEILKSENLQVNKLGTKIWFHINLFELQECSQNIIDLSTLYNEGWNQIYLQINSSPDKRLDMALNGNVLSFQNHELYWPLGKFSLRGIDGFIAKLGIYNSFTWDIPLPYLIPCKLEEYLYNSECLPCSKNYQEECLSLTRKLTSYTLGYFQVSFCPNLYINNGQECIADDIDFILIDFHKPFAQKFGNSSILEFKTENDMTNAYQRGLYFDGVEGKLSGTIFIFSPYLRLFLFIMPKECSCILLSQKGSINILEITIDLGSVIIKLKDQVFELSGLVTSGKWNSLFIKAEPSSNSDSTFEFYVNNQITDTFTASPIEILSEASASISDDKKFLGYLYQYFYSIGDTKSLNDYITTFCSSCSVCPSSTNECLSLCEIHQYIDTDSCVDCNPNCRSCRRSTSCSLSFDPFCNNYTEYDVCLGCKTFGYLLSTGCICSLFYGVVPNTQNEICCH